MTTQAPRWIPSNPDMDVEVKAALSVLSSEPVTSQNLPSKLKSKIADLARSHEKENGQGSAYKTVESLDLMPEDYLTATTPMGLAEQIVESESVQLTISSVQSEQIPLLERGEVTARVEEMGLEETVAALHLPE